MTSAPDQQAHTIHDMPYELRDTMIAALERDLDEPGHDD